MLYTLTRCKDTELRGTAMENKICAKKTDTEGWLQEAVNLSLYFDFYGELLNEKQKSIFEDYVANDMSLSEIAKDYGLSRQGVYDVVKRTGEKLYEYEERLHLAERFRMMEDTIGEIRDSAERMAEGEGSEPVRNQAREIAEKAEQLLRNL